MDRRCNAKGVHGGMEHRSNMECQEDMWSKADLVQMDMEHRGEDGGRQS